MNEATPALPVGIKQAKINDVRKLIPYLDESKRESLSSFLSNTIVRAPKEKPEEPEEPPKESVTKKQSVPKKGHVPRTNQWLKKDLLVIKKSEQKCKRSVNKKREQTKEQECQMNECMSTEYLLINHELCDLESIVLFIRGVS
ncbi:hypothetical protein QAD02_014092 [Eretmocerus hayati]|uniref:Uncharacterized protein n=1 Tax=Eretmocerus hayati TaxID=131215 RepID=A0ACC2P4J5_9HYME|nr:hypothetical protein QAD02_014092 [Eretmocerus hayati]